MVNNTNANQYFSLVPLMIDNILNLCSNASGKAEIDLFSIAPRVLEKAEDTFYDFIQ